MLAETQNEVYFTRMKSSMGDKAKMVDFIKPSRVLDVGSGGGEFAVALAEHGFEVVALDGSHEAVLHSTHLGVTTVEGYTHQISQLIPPHSFDTVTCSAILHEVYSYGDDHKHSKFTMDSLIHSLNEFKYVLGENGRIVIRDGVMPSNWNQMVNIRMKSVEGMRSAEKYLEMIPFRGTNHSTMRSIHLEKLDESNLSGNMEAAMEFLYTYTWGEENYPRETQELYGLFTLNDYVQFLGENGFNVLHAEEYIQPGYPENLKDKVELTSEGKVIPFPNSNCLIVAEKISE